MIYFKLSKRAKVQSETPAYKKKEKSESGETIYRYDEAAISRRWKEKKDKLKKLEKDISKVRKIYKKDLKSDDDRTRAIASIIGIMDNTAMRIGNEESAREGTFGASTLKVKHIKFSGGNIKFDFPGKGNIEQHVELTDKDTIKVIKDLMKGKKPNDFIFEIDGHKIWDRAVNRYLQPMGISAKDIRGFHANRLMKEMLKKKDFKEALIDVADIVGHKASTLKNQYLDPELVAKYEKTASPKLAQDIRLHGPELQTMVHDTTLTDEFPVDINRNTSNINERVRITPTLATAWNVVAPFLPAGATLSSGYRDPEAQVKTIWNYWHKYWGPKPAEGRGFFADNFPQHTGNIESMRKFMTEIYEPTHENVNLGGPKQKLDIAKPGVSHHQKGTALDISNVRDYEQAAKIIKWIGRHLKPYIGFSEILSEGPQRNLHLAVDYAVYPGPQNMQKYLREFYFGVKVPPKYVSQDYRPALSKRAVSKEEYETLLEQYPDYFKNYPDIQSQITTTPTEESFTPDVYDSPWWQRGEDVVRRKEMEQKQTAEELKEHLGRPPEAKQRAQEFFNQEKRLFVHVAEPSSLKYIDKTPGELSVSTWDGSNKLFYGLGSFPNIKILAIFYGRASHIFPHDVDSFSGSAGLRHANPDVEEGFDADGSGTWDEAFFNPTVPGNKLAGLAVMTNQNTPFINKVKEQVKKIAESKGVMFADLSQQSMESLRSGVSKEIQDAPDVFAEKYKHLQEMKEYASTKLSKRALDPGLEQLLLKLEQKYFGKSTPAASLKVVPQDSNLGIRPGVKVNDLILTAWQHLRPYLPAGSVMTSGARTIQDQTRIINHYWQKSGLSQKFPDVKDPFKMSKLLIQHGWVVGPPSAEGKKDVHLTHRAFDVSGADLETIAAAARKISQDPNIPVSFSQVLIEPKQNAVHIGIDEAKNMAVAMSEVEQKMIINGILEDLGDGVDQNIIQEIENIFLKDMGFGKDDEPGDFFEKSPIFRDRNESPEYEIHDVSETETTDIIKEDPEQFFYRGLHKEYPELEAEALEKIIKDNPKFYFLFQYNQSEKDGVKELEQQAAENLSQLEPRAFFYYNLHKAYPELGRGAILQLIDRHPISYFELGLTADYPDYEQAANDARNIRDPNTVEIMNKKEDYLSKRAVKELAPIAPMKLRKIEDPEELLKKHDDSDIIVQQKIDGFKTQAIKDSKGTVKIYTRRGEDFTSNVDSLIKELENKMDNGDFWLGELAWLKNNKQSISDIQTVVNSSPENAKKKLQEKGQLVFYVYDLLWNNGYNTTKEPYIERYNKLKKQISGGKIIQLVKNYSWDEKDKAIKEALVAGGEGIVIKSRKSIYNYGPKGSSEKYGDQWKFKPGAKSKEEDVIVKNYTKAKDKLVFPAYQHKDNKLIEVGKISGLPKDDEQWVKDQIDKGKVVVLEVGYQEKYENTGKLRHPGYHRIRKDKNLKEIKWSKN